jgi:hypothetical protein
MGLVKKKIGNTRGSVLIIERGFSVFGFLSSSVEGEQTPL